MFSKSFREALAALVAFVAALAVANGLDYAVNRLRLYASQTFDFGPFLWLAPLATIALCAGLVTLAWWLGARAQRNAWIGLGYVLIGLLAALYTPLRFTFGLGRFGLPLFGLQSPAAPLSYWSLTGSLLAAAGALHLLRRPRP
jgi:hypothetical protein